MENLTNSGAMRPGPTLYAAEQLRKSGPYNGLLAALGTPLSYAPIPAVAALGGAMVGYDQNGLRGLLESAALASMNRAGGLIGRAGGPMRTVSKIDRKTGLPLNKDGTVTLYHATTRAAADQIRKSGMLKSAGEPAVYLTTAQGGTGYGDGTVVPVKINPRVLRLDDEFPDGRKDFAVDVGKPGGILRVLLGD